MEGHLQSSDIFKERLKIGPDEKTLIPLSEEESVPFPLIGSYSQMNGRRILFYRWDGKLRLRIGDAEPLDFTGLEADWRVKGGRVHFTLIRGKKLFADENYPLSKNIINLPEDDTPFVEAEQFDFFLFIRNVLTDPVRAERMYRGAKALRSSPRAANWPPS